MMKLSVVLLLGLVVSTPVAGTELMLSTGIDWMLGIRGGIEYLVLPRVGVQAHAGISIAGAATADLFAVYRVLQRGRFTMSLLAGLPNAVFPIGASEFMVSVGGATELRWRLSRIVALSLRVGEGYPLFFAGGRFAEKGIAWPLGLWPDLFLSLSFAL